jgi:hypothetical protein
MRAVNTPSGLSVNPLGGVESTADAVDAKSSTNPRRAFHFCDPGRQPLDQFGLHDDQLNEFRVTSVWQLHRLSCNDCQQSARTRRRTQVDGYNATPPQPKDTSATKHMSCLVTSSRKSAVPTIQLITLRGSRDTGWRTAFHVFSMERVQPIGREQLPPLVGGLIIQSLPAQRGRGVVAA